MTLKKMKDRFSPKPVEKKVPHDSVSDSIDSQRGDSHLSATKQRGPAPTGALKVISRFNVQSPDVAICSNCQSRRYVEITFENGETIQTCACCRNRIVDQWSTPGPVGRKMSKNFREIFALVKECEE